MRVDFQTPKFFKHSKFFKLSNFLKPSNLRTFKLQSSEAFQQKGSPYNLFFASLARLARLARPRLSSSSSARGSLGLDRNFKAL